MEFKQIRVMQSSPTIGGEIGGIDLSKKVGEGAQAELHRALLEYKVLFFREQNISVAQHIAFARLFGGLEVHPFAPHLEGYPEVLVIEHGEKRRGRENTWHSDVTWRLRPALGSVLRALEVPEVGGDTVFADMYAAYQGLSDQMQRFLSGLTAIHDFSHVFGRGYGPDKLKAMQEQYPVVEHPVVRTHPETGRKALYVNAAFTTGIKGMPPEESGPLLNQLYRQASFPEYQCRFKWRPNSIAFWDNRAVQHYAVSDYFPNRRLMHRVTIEGDTPV
ncbi:MAG TPA: TauD/TfdA family dioxygenase [Candidatus Binataceae bacterium]